MTEAACPQIGNHRPGQPHAARLLRQDQAGRDDLAVVEPQLRQPVQPQFEEMHTIPAAVPDAAGNAAGEHRAGPDADFLDEFTPCRGFRRHAAAEAAAGEAPGGPVGRPHKQQRGPDMHRDHRAFVARPRQSPPQQRYRKAQPERRPPGDVDELCEA